MLNLPLRLAEENMERACDLDLIIESRLERST